MVFMENKGRERRKCTREQNKLQEVWAIAKSEPGYEVVRDRETTTIKRLQDMGPGERS